MPNTIDPTAIAALALLIAGPAGAQTSAPQSAPATGTIGIASPRPAPVPGATPVPTPDAPRVALPTQRAVPRAKPSPRPSPRASPTAKPTDTTSPKVAPLSVETLPVAEPGAQDTNPATPVAPLAPAQPTPIPTQDVAPPPPRDASPPLWPWLMGLAVAVAAIAFALLRRRRSASLAITHEPEVPTVVPEPAPVGRPTAPPSPAPQMLDRARPPAVPIPPAGLTIGLRPIRAGLNLLTATADCEVTVTNTGDTAAEDIRCDLRLLSTHAGQDDDLAAAFAAPGGRPIASAITLQPAQTRTLRGMAVLPRDAIRALNAGGRMMFVPLVAVKLAYHSGGQLRQTTQAFALGIERVDSAKLAPFWLDGPARMHDAVAARPHAPIER